MPKNPEAFGAKVAFDRPEHMIGFLVKSLQQTLRQTIEEATRKQGLDLSLAHFVALFGLHREPGITGAQLARRAFVSAQTMNSALRRLEREGRIERRPHPDSRRADSWSVTEAGLADLDRARRVGNAVFARMLAPLDNSEITAFEDYLRRCIGALGGELPPREAAAAPAKLRGAKRWPRQEAAG